MFAKLFQILFLIWTVNIFNVQSQSIYPVVQDQVTNGYMFGNPAAISKNNKLELLAANKNYFGLFQNIGVNYASCSYKIGSDSASTKKNTVGITFINEHDGDFLNRTRAQLLYALETKLTPKSKLGLGISFGYFNYYIKSSNNNIGASTWLPDGNIGLWLRKNNLNIGIAINQFTNAKSTLYVKEYRLSSFQVFNLEYALPLNSEVDLLSGMVIRNYQYSFQNDFFTLLKYRKMISGGINYRYGIGVSGIFSLDKLHLFDQYFTLTTSYSVTLGNDVLYNSSQLELCLKYYY